MWLYLALLLGLIPAASDFQNTAQAASSAAKPMVVYVSRPACGFCRAFEREVFSPLLKAGIYDDAVLFVELELEDTSLLRDFDGKPVTAQSFADRYGVVATPTLLFLAPDGEPLIRPLMGYNGSDFYPYYLERALDAAIARSKSAANP